MSDDDMEWPAQALLTRTALRPDECAAALVGRTIRKAVLDGEFLSLLLDDGRLVEVQGGGIEEGWIDVFALPRETR